MKSRKNPIKYLLALTVCLSLVCCIYLNTSLAESSRMSEYSYSPPLLEESDYNSNTIFSEVKLVKVLAEKVFGFTSE